MKNALRVVHQDKDECVLRKKCCLTIYIAHVFLIDYRSQIKTHRPEVFPQEFTGFVLIAYGESRRVTTLNNVFPTSY